MKSYSTYDAKARFSEILRLIRETGESVIVTYHGEPVAEIRPLAAVPGDALRERIERMERRGAVVRERTRTGRLREVVRKPGALERFLDERDS